MINLLHNVWGKSFTFSLNWCFLGKIMNLRKIDDHLASPPSPPTPPLSLRKNKSSSLSISSPHKNFNNYSAPTFNYRSIHIFNNIPPFSPHSYRVSSKHFFYCKSFIFCSTNCTLKHDGTMTRDSPKCWKADLFRNSRFAQNIWNLKK